MIYIHVSPKNRIPINGPHQSWNFQFLGFLLGCILVHVQETFPHKLVSWEQGENLHFLYCPEKLWETYINGFQPIVCPLHSKVFQPTRGHDWMSRPSYISGSFATIPIMYSTLHKRTRRCHVVCLGCALYKHLSHPHCLAWKFHFIS